MFEQGDKVRYSNGDVGEITGRRRGEDWQVRFSGVETLWIHSSKLEKVGSDEDMFDLFQQGKFRGVSDYRRRLYRYRLSGELTNLMYSMNNAETEFLPHQFIPVTKFLESYTDRLLIADEVGLGKTIEAMYIWEELLARKNAKRLLVVVPAVLRYKWQRDMKKFFGIEAEIVSAQGKMQGKNLVRHMEDAIQSPHSERFALIVSLEGIRISPEVRELLEKHQYVNKIFDLVIIDEAHYLRNSGTESFKTGEGLRDVAEHLLLLSATPIQTSSVNFFNLLNLLAPEDFSDEMTFDEQLMVNLPLVQLSNALERRASSTEVRPLLDKVLSTDVFRMDADFLDFSRRLDGICSDTTERVKMIDKIKCRYFYNGLVTRARKRDVFKDRTIRDTKTIDFKLDEYERKFYQTVTEYLQEEQDRQERQNAFSSFRLIARQRQMASCIPAALESWRSPSVTVDESTRSRVEEDEDLYADMLDAGECDVGNYPILKMPAFEDFDLDRLVRNDSKFSKILSQIKSALSENPREKIIIFSFYRHTVSYLYRRLRDEGVSATYIMGGIDPAEKNRRIDSFRDTNINVLVSSEVGSEGIDLQFARFEINYDMPWNPMRLEQRIGRIDRIGQESEKIYIFNAFCTNTIEDRVLARLYHRIEIFRNVIGDLEEILGKPIQDLQLDVFKAKGMSEAEIEARTEQTFSAICKNREISRNLEYEAGNLASDYQSYVLENIRKSYENVRHVTPGELLFAVADIVGSHFPGSPIKPFRGNANVVTIKLSPDAKASLGDFVLDNPSIVGTSLHYAADEVICSFNKKLPECLRDIGVKEEVDVNHPLVRWALSLVMKESLYSSGCEALTLARNQLPEGVDLNPGVYSYYIQQWKSSGVRTVNELRYYVADTATQRILDSDVAERLMVAAMLRSDSYDLNCLTEEIFFSAGGGLQLASHAAEKEYNSFREDQSERNGDLIEEQTAYIEKTAAIKAAKVSVMIDRLRSEGKKDSVIRMNEGRRDKILADRDSRIEHLRQKLDCSPAYGDVAVGVLVITGS